MPLMYAHISIIRDGWSRTTVKDFGDPYTNHCTTSLMGNYFRVYRELNPNTWDLQSQHEATRRLFAFNVIYIY